MHHRLCKCGCGGFVAHGSGQRFVTGHNPPKIRDRAAEYALKKQRLGKRCACGVAISPSGKQCVACQATAIRHAPRFCRACNKSLDIGNRKGTCKACLRGPLHHAYRGGTIHRGYRYFRQSDGTREAEHRLVWMAAKGAIPKGMHIHHKNHNKLDNRLENLEMMTIGEHKRHHNLHRKPPPAKHSPKQRDEEARIPRQADQGVPGDGVVCGV